MNVNALELTKLLVHGMATTHDARAKGTPRSQE